MSVRALHPRILPAAALVPLASALLFGPLFDQLGLADHDSLANMAQLRADGGGLGWNDGFFFVNALVLPINAAINVLTPFSDHYYLAWRVLVFTCTVALASAVGLLAARYGGRREVALLLALLVLTMPGIVRLFTMFEDNLVVSLPHVLYLAAYLRMVEGLGGARPWRTRVGRRTFVYAVFPLALLAVELAHRQFNVLWPTPLFLLALVRGVPWRRRLIIVGWTYLVAVSGALVVFVGLTVHWDGAFTTAGWLGHLDEWVTPGVVYHNFYFFNEFGWDLPRQARSIMTGLGRLFACALAFPLVSFGLWGLLMLTIATGLDWRRATRDATTQALVLMTLIHVPHSLIYESWNVERWDALLPPLMVLIARLHGQARGGTAWRVHAAVAGLVVAILAVNLMGYRVFSAEMRSASSGPYFTQLHPLLMRNVRGERSEKEPLLVLGPEEFELHFMLAEAFYSFREELVILNEDGTLVRSERPYPVLQKLTPEEARALMERRDVRMTEETRRMMAEMGW